MCPLCRKVEYDKKDYFEGHRILLMRYIVKIQALVRGFLKRLHFYERLKNEGMPLESTLLKRRLIAHKLERISKRRMEGMKKNRANIEGWIKKIDSNIESTAQLFE